MSGPMGAPNRSAISVRVMYEQADAYVAAPAADGEGALAGWPAAPFGTLVVAAAGWGATGCFDPPQPVKSAAAINPSDAIPRSDRATEMPRCGRILIQLAAADLIGFVDDGQGLARFQTA